MPSPLVLILGAGPRIGTVLTTTFLSSGYKVALASRKGQALVEDKNVAAFKADLSDPSTIPPLFDQVTSHFGTVPNVVIYNAGSLTPPPEEDNTFSISVEAVTRDLNINTISAYTAAQAAVTAWKSSGAADGRKKTFIYTGNATNKVVVPVPLMFTGAMGKSASAGWIGMADTLYKGKGIRFFYSDERHENGMLKGKDLDADAHGAFYLQLADGKTDGIPWDATFVKGKGYTKF